MNKQQLAAKIWESANKMRSKIEANEYKDYILGFIFYKFLSEKEVKYLKENDWTDEYLPELTEEDTETLESVQKNLGYFISYENLFSTWIEKGRDFSVQDVRDALSAFSRLINPTHKKVFEGVFDTLQTGLSKLGDSSASQSKAISDLIHLIKDIPMVFLVLFTNISSVCLPLMREKKQENFIPRTKFHCLCQKLLRII